MLAAFLFGEHMLQRIKNLVRALVCKTQAKAEPQASPRIPTEAVQPDYAKTARMHPTNLTARIGGTDYQVYHSHGSHKLPYALMGTTFVPLSAFKQQNSKGPVAIDCGTFDGIEQKQ